MKKLTLILFLFVTIVTNGQTFDFQKRELKNDINIVPNKNFTFTINNINTLKYDILIDNKTVNNNLDIPTQFKQIVDPNKYQVTAPENDTNTVISLLTYPEIKDFNSLSNAYVKLKTVEAFYKSLTDLVSSDISTIQLIELKTGFFKQFISLEIEDDNYEVPKISEYYSTLSTLILNNAPEILKNNPAKKSEIELIIENTNKLIESNVLSKLVVLYASINEETFTVNTFMKKPDADEVIINISAKPNATFKSGKEINIEIPLLVSGGFKVDFSSGIFVSSIVDKSYVNKPNFDSDTISGYRIVEEISGNNNFSYGLAGYMHVYWRCNKEVNIGGSLGVGIDQNTQTKIMPGICLMLGRKNRFILNAGAAIGKYKELSNIHYTDYLYKSKVDIIYSEPYKVGWYIGLSYNLNK